jgi:predicted dehydrogenase
MAETRRRFLEKLSAGLGAATATGAFLRPDRRAQAAEPRPAGRRLGYALVGLGKLSGGQLAPALQTTAHCRLTGLVSGHPEKARQWAQQYGVPEKNVYDYDNFDSIKDNPDIDIVYVVLPNSMHAEFTIRAAKAGKHVLCEKPMAVTVNECDEMIAACRAAGQKLAIAYRLHFEPYNLEMARLAREKVFGGLKVVEATVGFAIGDPTQWRLRKALAGGGSLVDLGIYALQAARCISGEEPIAVSAQQGLTDSVKFREVEESILFDLRFPSGVVATCASSYATTLNRYRAGAERGWFELAPAMSYHGIRGRSSGPGGLTEMQFPDVDQFAAEMDDFAECILSDRPTSVPGEEGRRDVRIITAIYEAAASGKTVAL